MLIADWLQRVSRKWRIEGWLLYKEISLNAFLIILLMLFFFFNQAHVILSMQMLKNSIKDARLIRI